MEQQTTAQKQMSLRAKATGWLAAILLVTLISIGIATAVGQWTVKAFDTLLEDNAACYAVQDAIKEETRAFEHYVREPSQESSQTFADACAAAEESLAALPFDYAKIGEDRYARTWSLRQGYAGYQKARDAFLQLAPSAEDYVERMYAVMDQQDYLAEYALRLTQATLEQENTTYSSHATRLQRLPWLYFGLLAAAVALMLLLIRVLNRAVVQPLLRLAQASRSIAGGDYTGADLPVHSGDEVGQLTGTFNRMKHAMAEHLSTLNALHREEVRNLALEKDLEHTRLEVLKSQVNPHFLFNTLNMISCMARLEDASTTDQMIVHLGSLFRHNLRTKQQEVTLEEELDGLEDYIYLQQMRFDGRITVEKKIEADPAAVRLPSFTLQPIVENAFSHGLKSCEEGGRILLRGWMQGRTLILTVADNGRGMTPAELDALQEKIAQSERTGRSIGLGNISRRITMLYPEGRMQVFSREGHGTVIRFEIPQEDREEDGSHEV
ncbi:MAG TPA: sensor histidine kinase [Faecalibacterium sp.]|nr:sensor histidine kinase [Faecalibacterium sp.]